MANRDIITRSGKGSDLDATDHDQNHKSFAGTVEEQTGTTYTVVYTDQNKTIELNNASMVCSLTAISTIAGQIDTDNFTVTLVNTNSTAATIQRLGTDTFAGGDTSISLPQYQSITLQTDSTGGIWNWKAKNNFLLPATANNLVMVDADGFFKDSLVETDGAGNITANVTGNVTGDLTGNADTATAFASSGTFNATGGDVTGSASSANGNYTVDLQIGAGTVGKSAIATDAVGNSEIDFTIGTAQSFSVTTGGWVIPEGMVNITQTSGSDIYLELFVGGAWRQSTVIFAGGMLWSDGSNMRLVTLTSTAVVYTQNIS